MLILRAKGKLHIVNGLVVSKTTVLQKYTFAVIIYSVNSPLPSCACFSCFNLDPQVYFLFVSCVKNQHRSLFLGLWRHQM